jgi:hypothetical protein
MKEKKAPQAVSASGTMVKWEGTAVPPLIARRQCLKPSYIERKESLVHCILAKILTKDIGRYVGHKFPLEAT